MSKTKLEPQELLDKENVVSDTLKLDNRSIGYGNFDQLWLSIRQMGIKNKIDVLEFDATIEGKKDKYKIFVEHHKTIPLLKVSHNFLPLFAEAYKFQGITPKEIKDAQKYIEVISKALEKGITKALKQAEKNPDLKRVKIGDFNHQGYFFKKGISKSVLDPNWRSWVTKYKNDEPIIEKVNGKEGEIHLGHLNNHSTKLGVASEDSEFALEYLQSRQQNKYYER